MHDELMPRLISGVKDGSIRKTFILSSRSTFWMPWIVGGVQDRIEVGLFQESSGHPEAASFGVEWLAGDYEPVVQVRSFADGWLTLPLLSDFPELVSWIAQQLAAPTFDQVASRLAEMGYVEEDYDKADPQDLALPPSEPILEPMPLSENVRWIGPHIGRSGRFLKLVEQFIIDVMKEGVVAVDFKADYRDSAFERLWECMDNSMVDQRLLAASGREKAEDVPYICTDTIAYVSAAVDEAKISASRCGVEFAGIVDENGFPVATLAEPISELLFQVWNCDQEEDEPRIAAVSEIIAARLGLSIDWDYQRFTLSLADNDAYRPHGVRP